MRRWSVAERIQGWEVGDKSCATSVIHLLHRYFVVENLSAFHQTALVWGEGKAVVHGRAVVEEDEVADLPLVGPDEARLFEMGVQFAE